MAQRIPEEVIEEVRSQTDIVDVVGEYVQLTKRGRNYFGLCPFHGEQTPSFSVSIDKQIYHCFGCGAGGNAITFLMDIEHVSFQEAVAKLGDSLGMYIDAAHSHQEVMESPASTEEKIMLEAHKEAAEYFQHLLLNTEEGEKGLAYLEERGFTREMIIERGIGYAMPNWESLTKLLAHKKFDLEQIEKCGLIIRREDGTGYFDRFRDRIMFPIQDDSGRIIAFSGRVLQQSKEQAKYMNSPESPIFQKSQVLYNLNHARAVIRKERKVVLFEGFMDVLAAEKADVGNGIASMGTALTLQHIQKLKRLSDTILVCYDGDSAGWEAAKRAAEMLHAEKLKIEVATLPSGLDPDDYIKQQGAKAFKEQIISEPQSFLSFLFLYAKRNKNLQYSSDIQQYIDEALYFLAKYANAIEKELYVKQLSDDTSVSMATLFADLRQKEAQVAVGNKKQESMQAQSQSRNLVQAMHQPKRKLLAIDRAERLLLAHMLHDINVFDAFREEEPPFVHEDYLAIYVHLLGFYETYDKADFQRFAEIVGDRELRKVVMEAALVERDPDHGDEEIQDCIKQVKKYKVEQQIVDKTHAMKEAEKMHDIKNAIALTREIIELKKSLLLLK